MHFVLSNNLVPSSRLLLKRGVAGESGRGNYYGGGVDGDVTLVSLNLLSKVE